MILRAIAPSLLGLSLLVSALGCGKHDCKLESESDQKAYGEIAEMTKGAFSCFPSNGELVATHADGATVESVTEKYRAFLANKGYSIQIEDHEGKRGNGESYKGKMLVSEKDGAKVGALIYPLTSELIETSIVVK
jgi:hypothetical protein